MRCQSLLPIRGFFQRLSLSWLSTIRRWVTITTPSRIRLSTTFRSRNPIGHVSDRAKIKMPLIESTTMRSYGKLAWRREWWNSQSAASPAQVSVRGANKPARTFSDHEAVNSIETEKSRIIVCQLESGWWLLAVCFSRRVPPFSDR